MTAMLPICRYGLALLVSTISVNVLMARAQGAIAIDQETSTPAECPLQGPAITSRAKNPNFHMVRHNIQATQRRLIQKGSYPNPDESEADHELSERTNASRFWTTLMGPELSPDQPCICPVRGRSNEMIVAMLIAVAHDAAAQDTMPDAVTAPPPAPSHVETEDATPGEKARKEGLKCLSKKDLSMARKHFEASHAHYLAAFGTKHPAHAWHLNILGCIGIWTDDVDAAERNLKDALSCYSDLFGKQNERYAETENNLAGLYVKSGKLDLARPLLERQLHHSKAQYGEAHPNYATALTNLAVLLLNQKTPDKAEGYLRTSLAVFEKEFGRAHLTVANVQEKLGRALTDLEQYESAEEFFRQSLEIRAKLLNADDVQIAESLEGFSALLLRTGRSLEAAEMNVRSNLIRSKGQRK